MSCRGGSLSRATAIHLVWLSTITVNEEKELQSSGEISFLGELSFKNQGTWSSCLGTVKLWEGLNPHPHTTVHNRQITAWDATGLLKQYFIKVTLKIFVNELTANLAYTSNHITLPHPRTSSIRATVNTKHKLILCIHLYCGCTHYLTDWQDYTLF